MKSIVLDCSVAVAWCFEDETSASADAALEKTCADGALVPTLWPLELQNVLIVAERRGRIQRAASARFLEVAGSLPIQVDAECPDWRSGSLISVARDLNISVYDAAYVELAMRQGAPLATLDKKLQKAAQKAGVKIFN